MIRVPEYGEVPVKWQPSDLKGPDSDGHSGRILGGVSHQIRAIVHHRVVGTLESMTNNTFYPTTDDILRAGERRVSSHFGIGFWGTELRIVQYVALEDTAYCNGQGDADRAACDWSLWLALGRPPTNEITVSIEHEDNANLVAGAKYVVREEIIKASIALDRLLLTGNGAAIRGAGIHCNDVAAAQLGRIKPSRQTLVDHHVIAPVSKPYCWRAIGDDKGFPQARYINELGGEQGGLVPQRPITTQTPRIVRILKGQDVFDLDGLTKLADSATEHERYSPCGRGSVTVNDQPRRWREVYWDLDGSGREPTRSVLVRVADSNISPVPAADDCKDEVAAAIAADRAGAKITWPT